MFCMVCGEPKRLRFPWYEPTVCTQRCAANALLAYADVDPEIFFCMYCGECPCGGDCDGADEE